MQNKNLSDKENISEIISENISECFIQERESASENFIPSWDF